MTDDTWLTVDDIVALLRINRETARRWLRSGKLPGQNYGGRMGYRVRKTDLDAFLARGGRTREVAAGEAGE